MEVITFSNFAKSKYKRKLAVCNTYQELHGKQLQKWCNRCTKKNTPSCPLEATTGFQAQVIKLYPKKITVASC
jgi:hypothetical protein